MSTTWSAPTTDDVLSEFTPAEKTAVERIQGATTNLAAILARIVQKVRGAIRAGGYALDEDNATFLPPELHDACIAIVRWRWVISLPVTTLATKPRETAADDAEKILTKIANQEYAVQPPTSGTPVRSGNWNSEQKLLGRMHPVPPPATQFPATGDPSPYANPDGPSDTDGSPIN